MNISSLKPGDKLKFFGKKASRSGLIPKTWRYNMKIVYKGIRGFHHCLEMSRTHISWQWGPDMRYFIPPGSKRKHYMKKTFVKELGLTDEDLELFCKKV